MRQSFVMEHSVVVGPDPNVKEGHSFWKHSKTWSFWGREGIEDCMKGKMCLV